MTGGYGLLAPSMIAVLVAYLLSGSSSVFYNQVDSVEDSPAHFEEYETLALKRILVSDVMITNIQSLTSHTNLKAAQDLMETDLISGYPILSETKLIGIVTRTDILKVEPSKRAEKTVKDVMSRKLLIAYPDEDLFSALIRMISNGIGRLPIVSHDNPQSLVGIITRTDIAKAIEEHRSTQESVTK